jgi:aerobic carbon-monoxide dehydrogenase small subunit
MSEKQQIRLTVNGIQHEALVEPRRLLADFLREDLELTGTHVGCEHGVCGACTVLLNGETVRACLLFAVQTADCEIMTVEGLSQGSQLHPIQEAFWEHHALQCGFCTPGFLMTAQELLTGNPSPTETEIREAISGNLCRCTGYQNIVTAIKAAAEKMAQSATPTTV